jgi:hypothetical protein
MFAAITGVHLVSITTQKVYYAGRLYDVSYLRFPASPLVLRFVSSQNHALIWDYVSTTVRLCTVLFGISHFDPNYVVDVFGTVCDVCC